MNIKVTAFTERKKFYYIINRTLLRADLLQVSIETCAWLSVVMSSMYVMVYLLEAIFISRRLSHIFMRNLKHSLINSKNGTKRNYSSHVKCIGYVL